MALVPPDSLKPLHAYVKLAADNDTRDPVIAYWIRYYVVHKAMKLDKSSPEAVSFLTSMMDLLESTKSQLKDNEAVTNDMVAQACVENFATKLFDHADREDREANATLKTVKVYLAANQVFETLSVFAGGMTEDVSEKQKYAKYRASVIMKAIKAGEPVPLPENLAGNFEKSTGELDPFANLSRGEPSQEVLPPAPVCDSHAGPSSSTPAAVLPPATASQSPAAASTSSSTSSAVAANGTPLSTLSVEKAQKFCKYAGSALNYDDVKTAIDNLEKALHLLKTGQMP